MIGYRLLRKKNGNYKTIVHGVNRSRTVPFDTWLEADVTWRPNPGSKNQPHYWTGFHCFQDVETAKKYQKKFKNPKPVIVEIEFKDYWDKPTNPNVKLARFMKLNKEVEND